MHRRLPSLAALAALASQASAQLDMWQPDQVRSSICTWEQPRAAILRDTIYIDGGDIWWTPYFADGSAGAVTNDGNIGGIIFTYNLTYPFDSDSNLTDILLKHSLSKARGGTGQADLPNFYDGGMLANDARFILYGGIYPKTGGAIDEPDADELLEYQGYQYGPEKPLWQPGFGDLTLPDGITRYVTFGAAANAPSENKAWYFSGMTTATHGNFYYLSSKQSPTNISNTMIQVDMTDQLTEKWANKTLPEKIQGRSNAEVVWVPVGEQGILVVIGGAVYPYWAGGGTPVSPDEDAAKEEGPKFMSTIDIYDIANDEWYQQNATDSPGARARGCAVLGVASDSSSFNIYYYGGFDGVDATEDFNDDVWVLSLPSFTWTKINDGDKIHARAGHKCFMVYPDQMMVLGGYTPLAGTSINCLKDGPVVNFNVTSGEWMKGYDPNEFGAYGVHEKIQSKIGGDASGKATATAPAGGWATSDLSKVFDTSYATSKIATYYPYGSASSTSRPDLPGGGDSDKKEKKGGSGLPSWVAPVLGVVLGLMFVTGCLVIFCLWRRRRIFKSGSSEAGTVDTGMRIISWMRGQQAEKATTVTTSDDTPKSPEMEEAKIAGNTTPSGADTSTPAPVEMANTYIAELDDTSPPVELHDNPMSPAEIIQKHTNLGQGKSSSAGNPSYSSVSAADHISSVSRTTAANSSLSPQSPAPSALSPSSPTPRSTRVTSDVSGFSERDVAQLRTLSETNEGDTNLRPSPPRNSTNAAPGADTSLVVSPPSAQETPRQDYLSAKPTTSPSRKSIFKEEEDDHDVKPEMKKK